jgi:hypothetical protein
MKVKYLRFSKVPLKIFVCIVLIVCLFFLSFGSKLILALPGNLDLFEFTAISTPNFSTNTLYDNLIQRCSESTTNVEGIKISSSFAGKYNSIQLKDDFIPSLHSPQLSRIIDKGYMSNKRIALVFPTFTAAAYYKAFYTFYRKHISTLPGKNVTVDLDLLSTNVNNQISPYASGPTMLFMVKHLEDIIPNLNLDLLSDQDVDGGCIFSKNGNNKIDVVILGHQEYVTEKEYDNLKKFVANGGTVILLDSNVLFAEVKYDANTNKVTLVKGHSWAFNGKSAWRSVNERWKNETEQWIGSNYYDIYSAKFLNNPFNYIHHEEQSITNSKDMILLDYKLLNPQRSNTLKAIIAAYELDYLKGRVISLGIYSDDIINNLKFDSYLDQLLMHNAIERTT